VKKVKNTKKFTLKEIRDEIETIKWRQLKGFITEEEAHALIADREKWAKKQKFRSVNQNT